MVVALEKAPRRTRQQCRTSLPRRVLSEKEGLVAMAADCGTDFQLESADPALVNCAAPRRWISVHDLALASQKLTCPVVTGSPPALTEAVSRTGVPELTLLTSCQRR